MQTENWDTHVAELRVTTGQHALIRIKEYDLAPEEEAAIAGQLWDIEMRERIEDREFDMAWYYLKAAALGERVFEGPNRVCRTHLEGLPVGIVCSPESVMGMLHVLYYEMSKAGLFRKPFDPFRTYPSWEATGNDGTHWQLMQPGCRVAQIMRRQHSICYYIAGLQAMVIGEWVNSYRLYALKK